jgi:pimeloyl-ACP methyl ester carboxylesterase
VKHAQNPDPQEWEKVMREQIIDKMPAKDRELFKDPEIQAQLIEIMREAFRQGAEGYVVDTRNIMLKWPFDLRDVKGRVIMWNGTDDLNTPVQMARWQAERLQNATLKEFPGETHLTIFFNHEKQIMEDLLEME